MAYLNVPLCQPVNTLPVMRYSPPVPPTVQILQPSYTVNTVTLVCAVTSSFPITYVYWQINFGGTIKTIFSTTNTNKYAFTCTGSTLSLTIFSDGQNDAGHYTCFALNIVGTGQSSPITLCPPTVQILQPSYTVNAVTLVCAVTTSFPITYVYWQRNFDGTITTITSTTNTNKYAFTFSDSTLSLTIFSDGQNDAGHYTCFALNNVGTGQSSSIILPLRIPFLHITWLQKLGEGHFAEVFLGIWNTMNVAIKTLKVGNANTSFMKEVEQLTKIKHRNIVTFFGICPEKYIMVFEYMKNGDLLNYLRKHRLNTRFLNPTTLYVETLPTIQLYHIAKQISAGMVYLTSLGFVHRDLAARNCLVGENLIVKIGDFGLCRDVSSTDYYRAGCSASLPVRWMAPESLLNSTFNVATDVWSFGVVLWEIFTYGLDPWYLLPNEEVKRRITNGEILDQPFIFPVNVYEIMKGCWRLNPVERSTMIIVHEQIKMSERLYRLSRLHF